MGISAPLVRAGLVTSPELNYGQRIAAGALLLVTGPVLFAAAAVTLVLSGRSPLIAHRRVGRYGREFWMLKLRTMWPDEGERTGLRPIEYVEQDCEPEVKAAGDPRVTSRFAAFCRRHSLDELPQLWHVITGEMALVGPRPVTRSELERYYGVDAAEVLQARPGITGLWQVCGRNRLSYAQRRRLDLRLVRRSSRSLDWAILGRSLRAVWRGGNAW